MVLAWAHALTSDRIGNYLARVPGLGAVLYPGNYHLASEVEAVAYVPSIGAAQMARKHPFRGFIVGRDEPNVTGPSGAPIPANVARAQHDEVATELAGHPGFVVPASLGAKGGFFATLLHRQGFDHAYHRQRGVTTGCAWASTRSRLSTIRATVEAYEGHHVLSPALFRGGWDAWLQPSPVDFVRLSSNRVHVAVWSLESWTGQPEFGLFDRDGTMTNVGQAVRDALRG